MPVSWKGTLVQYAGRLHRLHPGKTEVRIYDYVDREVPLFLRMFDKRLRGYRAIGYARDPRGLRTRCAFRQGYRQPVECQDFGGRGSGKRTPDFGRFDPPPTSFSERL